MNNKNSVFIATSMDGFIADKAGGLDWLNTVPNPDNNDMGYGKFIANIDAIIMGRTTFETVCSFDMDWPYTVPVFVLSNTIKEVPTPYQDKVEIRSGSLSDILDQIHKKGFKRLYIDGGSTVQGFLKENLIDELIITTIPILLGGGSRLFADLPSSLELELTKSEVFLHQIVQNHYTRL